MSSTSDVTMDASPTRSGARKGLLLALLLVVLGATASGAILLLSAGEEVEDVLALDTAPRNDDVNVTTSIDDGELIAVPATTYEVFLSRDPFEPVVPEPESATPVTNNSGDAGDDADSNDPDNGATDSSAGDIAGGDEASGDSDGCSGTTSVVCDGRTVSLVDITDREGELVAVVQIDTTLYEVRKGETFAQHFVLKDLTKTTATIAYVEDAFTLMVGDRVLK
jgi:hypothetical protein